MRFNHRSPSHWFAVALVLGLGLFTLNHAHGQSTGAAAAFEGRPAMAGAQGGLGAQAGMPQGGIGVQGNEAAQRQLNLRKPSGLDSAPPLGGGDRRHQPRRSVNAPTVIHARQKPEQRRARLLRCVRE
jgi:hypothetical protein